jgi:hypothetical protein
MLIKDLSKEIGTQDMTAVRGGSADAQGYIPIWNGVTQGNSNAVAGNAGPVQIDNNNSASVSTDVRVPTNYGVIVDLTLPLVRRLLPL